jgi:hypothetical protein
VRRQNHEGRVVEIVGKKGKRAGEEGGKARRWKYSLLPCRVEEELTKRSCKLYLEGKVHLHHFLLETKEHISFPPSFHSKTYCIFHFL